MALHVGGIELLATSTRRVATVRDECSSVRPSDETVPRGERHQAAASTPDRMTTLPLRNYSEPGR